MTYDLLISTRSSEIWKQYDINIQRIVYNIHLANDMLFIKQLFHDPFGFLVISFPL